MADPKVSVVIPTYNRADLIRLTLESVQRQSFPDYEIVVIDDGSTDGTDRVVAEQAPEARYLWQENVGIPEAINACVRAARGEYIAFLGSDDALLPGALERQVAALDSNPRVGMVHGAAWLMDETGRLTEILRPRFAKGDYVRSGDEERVDLLFSNHIVAPTVMIRRKCFDDAGMFDLRFGLYEDWNMWNRVLQHWDIAYIHQPVTCYRVHGGKAGSIFHTADPRRLERFRRLCLEEALDAVEPAARNKAKRAAWARHYYTVALQGFDRKDNWFGRRNALRAILADPPGKAARDSARMLARSLLPPFLLDAARRLRRPAESAPGGTLMTVEAALRGELSEKPSGVAP
jgi:glycosyltransferase involved in cell wall biosynthesis